MKIFYSNNHERDNLGHIIKRDYTTFEAIECSLCHSPIIGTPTFSFHDKSFFVYGLASGFRAPNRLKPFVDLSNIDYCQSCKDKMETTKQSLLSNIL